ncbi:hypothetical protein LOC67_02860 [Stieleria sp. JC731]|uniref:hypothetical protein n=1 Tax=Pirellulaceae TaxID=2691357 RepID=UPI001E45C26B|nr:hypothetical protein [Stieleria sp. JC731]MCC9599487.1 hypothetical protein [Stieleria sp. JC731]
MDNKNAEPWLPRISLRLLIGVVTISAVSMAVIQQALMTNAKWAVLASAAVISLLLPFVLYIASFSLANLFSSVGALAARQSEERRIHTATETMPDAFAETEA